MTLRYFTGTDLVDGRIWAVFRAEFEGRIMIKEEIFSIPNGEGWVATRSVSRWNFIGDNEIDETTQALALSLLPNGFAG